MPFKTRHWSHHNRVRFLLTSDTGITTVRPGSRVPPLLVDHPQGGGSPFTSALLNAQVAELVDALASGVSEQ